MKFKRLTFVASVLVAAWTSCGPGLAAGTESAVRKDDADWAAAAGAADADAWLAYYGADAIVLLPREPLAGGADQVRDAVRHFLAAPGLSVAWHPLNMELAKSGDLAYLLGAYEITFGDTRGTPIADRGKHLEIWRKQAGGSWKCIVDIWTPDRSAGPLPAAAAAVAAAPASAHGAGPTAVSPAQVPATKYGDRPIRYADAIRQYLREHLRDPDSVQFREITVPRQGYTTMIKGTILMREARNYGWIVKATIDAKDSQGHYAGFKTYTFLFRGEKIIDTLLPVPDDELK